MPKVLMLFAILSLQTPITLYKKVILTNSIVVNDFTQVNTITTAFQIIILSIKLWNEWKLAFHKLTTK